MNIERMQLLAEALEHIEERKDFIFDMSFWFYTRYKERITYDVPLEACGYAGCVVGLTHAIWAAVDTNPDAAREHLGLTFGQADWLFMGQFSNVVNMGDISAAQCAVAVRYLITNPDKLDLPIPL